MTWKTKKCKKRPNIFNYISPNSPNVFYNSMNLNCIGALSFSVHTFLWFLKSNWSSDFGHAETGSGAKRKRVVLPRELFCFALILKSSGKAVFEQKFAFSLVVFCSHAAISFWFLLFFFSIFWIGFFLNGFPNPFIVHSMHSFLFEPNFHFLLVVFLFTCGILTLIFCFFFKFFSDFSEMVFPFLHRPY